MVLAATTATQAIPMPGDRGPIEAWSDEQLLREFLSRTDESAETAFAALIERHGSIVHRVCLDVLCNREAARDAAQAVFLVLARRAGSIRKPESLGPWLHGVAFRVARRARSEDARRRAVERRKAEIIAETIPRRWAPTPSTSPSCTRRSIDFPRNIASRSSSATCRGKPRSRPRRHSAGPWGRSRFACTAAGTACGRG